MNTARHSLAYRLVKWRLARKHSKYYVALNVVLAAAWFAWAYWEPDRSTINLMIGFGFLTGAYSEWEILGFSELFQEQQRFLDDARAGHNTSASPGEASRV